MSPSAVGMLPEQVARSSLKDRSIPHMQLSNGSDNSMTPAPKPLPHKDPLVSAQDRFAIKGNAIVTGGTGTLGLEACNALLEHGLSGLMIFDVSSSEQSHDQLLSLRARFPVRTIEFAQVDVTDDCAVADAVESAASVLGSIDHLLCFSGIVGCTASLDMTSIQWRRVIDVNTTGAFLCAQAVARKMVDQESGGSILLTASISAHRVNYPQPQVAYNVSKAALITLKNCLAAEWAQYGIRTNTISPGYMDTILNEGEGIESARNIWSLRNPSGRMGVPAELMGAVVMLSSVGATYINGADIVVDGGGTVF